MTGQIPPRRCSWGQPLPKRHGSRGRARCLGLAAVAGLVVLGGCHSAGPAPLGAGLTDVWGGVSVVRAQATPDGSHVLLATRAADGPVRPLRWFLYRRSDGRTLALTHGDDVRDRSLDAEVWLRPDGAELAVLQGDRLRIVSVTEGTVVAELDRAQAVTALPSSVRPWVAPAKADPATPTLPPLPRLIPEKPGPVSPLPPLQPTTDSGSSKSDTGKSETGAYDPSWLLPERHEGLRRELPRLFEPADSEAYFAELYTRLPPHRLAERFWAARTGIPSPELPSNAAIVIALPIVPPSYVGWSADRYGVADGLSRVTMADDPVLTSEASQTARAAIRTVLLPADLLAAAIELAFRGPTASVLRSAAQLR